MLSAKENERSYNGMNEDTESLPSSLSDNSRAYCADESVSESESKNLLSTKNNACTLNDVCGLSHVKETLFNIFVYPVLFPHLFPRKIQWKLILFYGPPGTGKTLLAKAIANEMNATFYRISSADLLSHWQGESEKQIRRLFQELRCLTKSTVLFFDEIDGLCRKRTSSEDDSVRRIKTELLTQLDDFGSEPENYNTYILGATNCPWEIDPGFIRRFQKQIYVPLPEKDARLDIIKRNFDNVEVALTDKEWNEVAIKTEGFSCCDLANVVMNSCCERFLEMRKCKYWEIKGDLWIPASSHSLFLTRMNFDDIPRGKVGSRSIIFSDLEAGISQTSKTINAEELKKYTLYDQRVNHN